MFNLISSALTPEVFYRCVEDCFEPIMLTDIKGTLLYVNPSWCMTYGYSRDEAIGSSPRLLRSEHQSDEFYKNMWKTILDPKIGFWRGEVINRAKDGHFVSVLLTITPYRTPEGNIIGYMGIAVDLSEQKQMEHQILRQDRLASIGMLAGGMAHEIGNPMGVIRGRAELLRQQVEGNDSAAKNLDVIIGQIDRISGLIQSLLKVSRVPEHILLRAVSVKDVVIEVQTLISETCRKSGVTLVDKTGDQKIMAEAGHLQQVLLNLVINALHAIEEKTARGLSVSDPQEKIEVSCESKGEFCELHVTDTGYGISEENLKKIFRPFFTTKAAGKGTGMGLAIAAKQIEEMKGCLTAKSGGEGRGSTFTIRLHSVT